MPTWSSHSTSTEASSDGYLSVTNPETRSARWTIDLPENGFDNGGILRASPTSGKSSPGASMFKRTITLIPAITVAAFLAVPHASAQAVKTAAVCNAEYKTDKGALKAAKETKKAFLAACRALPPGMPTPIGTAAAQPAPSATTPPVAPASQPTRASAPVNTATPSRRADRAASPGESACGNGYAHLPASHTAAQFCDEAQAKARCPGQPVVWVNTASKVFHVAGSNTYGHTKVGAYMCEADATAEGDKASRNGH